MIVNQRDHKCGLCDDFYGDAMWHGYGISFYICRQCAVTALPKLIADAVISSEVRFSANSKTRLSSGLISRLTNCLKDVHANFWYAIASALVSKSRSEE